MSSEAAQVPPEITIDPTASSAQTEIVSSEKPRMQTVSEIEDKLLEPYRLVHPNIVIRDPIPSTSSRPTPRQHHVIHPSLMPSPSTSRQVLSQDDDYLAPRRLPSDTKKQKKPSSMKPSQSRK